MSVANVKEILEDEPAEEAGADTADESGTAELGDAGERAASQKSNETVTAVSTAKKVLGAKDAAPFAWKVIGLSENTMLVLFKSSERAEAEAQLARLSTDGYYTELRIVEIDARIIQPKPEKTRRSTGKSSAKKVRPAERKSAKTKPAAKKKTVAAKKCASKKGGARPAVRAKKPKKGGASSTAAKKKAAKRK